MFTKYPLGSVIPEYDPDESVCRKAVNIAVNVRASTLKYLKNI